MYINKEDFSRVLFLLAVGLFTAAVMYPLLHEAGHSLAALLLGGRVVELRLFPIPSVLCDVGGIGSAGLVVFALCGAALP